MKNPRAGAHLKVLLTLTGAVLLVHLALLRASPLSLGLSQPEPALPFITRTIEAAAAVTPAPVPQPVKPRTPPKPPQPAPASPPKPPAAVAPTNSSDASPAAPTAVTETDASSNSAPSAPAQDNSPAPPEQVPQAPRPPREPAHAVGAVALPGSARLKYQVDTNKFPFSLNAELLWQQSSKSYNARLEFSAFGQARVQTSRGDLTPEGLAPIRFSDKFRSEVAAHFNREQGKVTFSANTPDVPLLAGAQDRLSILVQLAAMLAGDPSQFPPATTITLQTIGPRDGDTWLFTVGSPEALTLPIGELATQKLVRNPRQEFDQKVELWLAPTLGYLPARIRITEPNGDFIDQKLLSNEP